MAKLRSVLVIDDEPDNFDVIETLLHGADYQLEYALSGQRALDRLATWQPDVILLDVMMPDLDGMAVCRQIKATPQWQTIPIIMVTALTAQEDLAACLEAGADDFISKPVNGIELRSRVQSMLRIKQHYDDLQGLLKQRQALVNMVVHDLRNPLASILLVTELLQMHLQRLSPQVQRQKIEQIAIAGQQLHALIDSLLLLAKLESGKMQLNCLEVDLRAVCTSALADFEAIAAEKSLTLVSHLPEPGGSIWVDVVVFRRVLDNLLSNAIKFSPENSLIRLSAEYLATGGASVQVADRGPGVSEAVRQSVFEQYEVGTMMRGVNQIGLGLAFCKIAIEAHGGKIAIADNQPTGTIVAIDLPPRPRAD
jgi:two-component system, sensor histidine kinase and response regulator